MDCAVVCKLVMSSHGGGVCVCVCVCCACVCVCAVCVFVCCVCVCVCVCAVCVVHIETQRCYDKNKNFSTFESLKSY